MKKLFKFIKNILILSILIFIFFAVSTCYDGYELYNEKVNEISIENKVAEIKNSKKYVVYDEISKDLLNAIVAIEDNRFFKHPGVDLKSIMRAFVNNINKKELDEGGSTITQQLAKNMYYTQEKKFTRKVAECITAIELEKRYNKEEILEMYVNIVYFGEGCYGIYDAANVYFDTYPKDLTLSQSSMLAGLPNAPSILSDDIDLAKRRQKQVLDAMVKNEYITQDEANAVI